MSDQFRTVFRLQAFHSYFENGICDCFDYAASDKTRKLSETYKFYLIRRTAGFEFYVNTSRTVSELLQYIVNIIGESYFEFEVSCNYPNFYLFTEFPLNWTGQVLFSSQSKNNVRKNKTIQLVGSLSEVTSSSIIARLRIYFADLLEVLEKNNTASFEIHFKSRPTQWQYYIINSSRRQLDHPKLTGASDIAFEGPENVSISNGQEAILFTSGATLIPLSELPYHKFNLMNTPPQDNGQMKKAPISKPVFLGLPNPKPERIGIIKHKGKNIMASPMYVYV